jgi:hypothetical protein
MDKKPQTRPGDNRAEGNEADHNRNTPSGGKGLAERKVNEPAIEPAQTPPSH